MSTIDDLIPDVEYESDASTNSTASVARKKILKSNEKFDNAVNSVSTWVLFIVGIIAFLGALLAPLIPWVGNKISDFSKPIQLVVQTVIYMIIYGVSWALKFFNVF